MLSSQEVITYELKMLQKMQQIHTLANTLAASHALKSLIANQIIRLDELESHLLSLSSQRGWDVPDFPSFMKLLTRLHFRRENDPSIAENLIYSYTDVTIEIRKRYNQWYQNDTAAQNLTQKFLDCCEAGIRQMQQFL